jgi:hypothetical protein
LLICLAKVVRVPHGPVIEVSQVGIRDRRISFDIIPWSGIESLWRLPQSKRLLLILDAAVDNNLPRSKIGEWVRHRRLKAYLIQKLTDQENPYDVWCYGHAFGDVSIAMIELVGSFETLVRAVEQARGVIGDTSWATPSRRPGRALNL